MGWRRSADTLGSKASPQRAPKGDIGPYKGCIGLCCTSLLGFKGDIGPYKGCIGLYCTSLLGFKGDLGPYKAVLGYVALVFWASKGI